MKRVETTSIRVERAPKETLKYGGKLIGVSICPFDISGFLGRKNELFRWAYF